MKAAIMEGPGRFVCREVPRPSPGAGEALVRVRACAVCGSDLTVYKMGVEGRILGHEFSGDIAVTGAGVADWSVGDRVVIDPQLSCGECHWCRQGEYHLCDSLAYTGLAADGGFAEYAVVPAYQLHRLPDSVSFEQGALVEPLAVALRGVRLGAVQPGESVAVFGCGAVGLFAMLWARQAGAGAITAIDPVPARRDAASGLADTLLDAARGDIEETLSVQNDGIGPDVIFECSGNDTAQSQAVNSVRKGGRVIVLGIGYEPVPLQFMQLTVREVAIRGSLGYRSRVEDGEFERAIGALASGEIDSGRVPVWRFGLDDIGSAFDLSLGGQVAKAIVLP